jgi:hypothetical protein
MVAPDSLGYRTAPHSRSSTIQSLATLLVYATAYYKGVSTVIQDRMQRQREEYDILRVNPNKDNARIIYGRISIRL